MQHHIMAAACCVFVISLCFQFKTAVAFLLWANALFTVGKACCNDWSGLSESIQSGRFCLCGVFKSFGLTRIWESRRYIRYLSCWLKSQTQSSSGQNVCRNFPVSEHLKHVLSLVLILFDPHSSDCDRSPFLLSDLRVIRTVGQRVTLMFAVSEL